MDQSCNPVILPCNINIIQSCFAHLNSNSYNYSSWASTIIISTHTPPYSTVLAQDSKADWGYLFYTELIIYYGAKEL